MKLFEIAEKLELTLISGKLDPETEIKGVYVSDLLSDVMGNAKAGDLWISLQSHKNIIAVAELKDICAIVIINGNQPDEDTRKKSEEDGIPLLGTQEYTFQQLVGSMNFLNKMNYYKGDLHIHSVLSPCGDLNMSPLNIIDESLKKGLHLIAITDHNSTLHCKLSIELGEEKGLFVIPACEITSKEEVHCLVFFENIEKADLFQAYIDRYMIRIPNDPKKLGYQVQVDRNEMIIYEEKNSLFSVVDQSVEEIEYFCHQLDGIFVPAHINKKVNSLISQLGFIPTDLNYDALEIEPEIPFPQKEEYVKNSSVLYTSDAHYLEDIAKRFTIFKMQNLSFGELKKAFATVDGREIIMG